MDLQELLEVQVAPRNDMRMVQGSEQYIKLHEAEGHTKLSIYPAGMLNTRMISLIPSAVDIVNFMRKMDFR